MFRLSGTAYDCGVALGDRWRAALRLRAATAGAGMVSLLCTVAIRRLLERYAPVLVDLHRGMARGAGLLDTQLLSVYPSGTGTTEGCTSFAAQPAATRDGVPLSGQSKDTPADRIARYEVLALETREGLGLLTLTYPGWLFGHGFAVGGCAIFRNALNGGNPGGALPYDVWGLLAQTCPTVEQVRELTRAHGVRDGFHCVLADEQGGVLGIEAGRGGYAFLEPKDGLYVHANHVVSGEPLSAHADEPPCYGLAGSHIREARLRARLESLGNRLTAALAFDAFTDHEGHPDSLCSDARASGDMTTAVVVAEPVHRRLLVSRGLPCQNPAVAYALSAMSPLPSADGAR